MQFYPISLYTKPNFIKMIISRNLLLSLIVLISGCTINSDPKEILDAARKKLLEAARLNYKAIAMYPNPMGKVDTTVFNVSFVHSEKSLIGYDYMIEWRSDFAKKDLFYTNDDYKVVDHLDKLVKFFSLADSLKEVLDIQNSLPVKNSPLSFLKQPDWVFEGDTVFSDRPVKNFLRIENDKTNDNGDTILTEQHIFIDPSTKLLNRFERRNYFNGKLSQLVVYEFTDFEISNKSDKLTYNFPSNYQSAAFGVSPYENLLMVGQKAPDFTTRDEQNNLIRLSDYLGKKVLLDFSIISCGYCLESLKHFNQKGYQLSDTIVPLYINPMDNQNDITEFKSKFNIPFPVAYTQAAEIAKLYGVLSYPLFYLIDENGIIEKVITGYDSEFQNTLKR
jgi:peroxiredoxin